MESFLVALGDEIRDADEETFDLFSQSSSLPDLGMIDAKATTLDISIGGRDFTIAQSPGLLQSNREGGTTGAAVWQSSVRVTEWLVSPTNILRQHDILNPTSTVLELGSGISGIVPCTLAPLVKRVIATDQTYLLKTLQENIDANVTQVNNNKATPSRSGSKSNKPRRGQQDNPSIDVFGLDWEHDDVQSTLTANGAHDGVDVVIACDCIYNYALISSWVQACADICELRSSVLDGHPQEHGRPTLCLIVQQLRQAEVFEQWLQTTLRLFRLWRVPGGVLNDALGEGSGFAVHVGILR